MSTDTHYSLSPATSRRSRTRPSLSRWPLLNGMTRRPARDVSLSPRRHSFSSLARQSSWDRCMSPCTRRMFPNRRGRSSYSRSSTPRSSRRPRSGSRSSHSRFSSRDRLSCLYAVDQFWFRLLDMFPVPRQEDEPEADQSLSSEDNKMWAEAVRTLFTGLVSSPASSQYADPFLDLDLTNSPLDLYVKDAVKSQMIHDSDELNTHGVPFQNYHSFHHLSSDQDREDFTCLWGTWTVREGNSQEAFYSSFFYETTQVSLTHQSPLDSLHSPRSRDSYQCPPGHSFRGDSGIQSSYCARPSSSNKGQSSCEDKKPASQQSCSRGGNQSSGQSSTRRDKEKGSLQYCSFSKKGRGGGGNNQRK